MSEINMSELMHKAGKGSSATSGGSFNALGFNGGDLFYCISKSSELANVMGTLLVTRVAERVRIITDWCMKIQDNQRAETQAKMDEIKKITNGGNIDSAASAKLQGLTTEYNDIYTKYQQLQTTAGGHKDGTMQEMTNLNQTNENFMTNLQKATSIISQVAR